MEAELTWRRRRQAQPLRRSCIVRAARTKPRAAATPPRDFTALDFHRLTFTPLGVLGQLEAAFKDLFLEIAATKSMVLGWFEL